MEPSCIRSPPHGSASSGWALPFHQGPEVLLPPPRLQAILLSRALGRRAVKGGAPAAPARTCCALSALRRECGISPPEASKREHTPNLHPPPAPGLGSIPQFLSSRPGAGRAARKAGIGKSKQTAQGTNVKEALNLCKGRAGTQEWGFLKHCPLGTSLASSSLVLALEERHSSTQRPHKALYPNSPDRKAEIQHPAVGKVNSPFSMEGIS